MPKQKIRTFLWYDSHAEEAANFYVSLFKNSKVTNVTRCGDAGPGPAGSVLTVEFELAGVEYIALNGGPYFHFTEAVSLSVDCDSQAEIDELWDKFIAGGGTESQCGWLKDKYGLSWQIVPSILSKLLYGKQSSRVMPVMMRMKKLDIAALERAAEGK
jgi:predicted 3-demethylubiquinone-9 3-methyltransferase (glyoxalase superfamily)